MNPLNIVFAGTPEFGLPCLDALQNSIHCIQAIYTQPDRPFGRGRKLHACAVKQWALTHNIPVYQPLNFKHPETITELSALKPDVLVVIAYGLILPKAVLEIPRLGCMNVHASLLPRWRGASPIQSAILHGDTESGITLMQMDAGLDTGAMLHKVCCPITHSETTLSLHDKLAKIAAQPLLETLDKLANHKVQQELQDNKLATYSGKINKEDACIHWQQTALEIDRKIRAFNPWPIAFTRIGETILRIHQAKVAPMHFTQAPGTVVHIDKKGMLVATQNQSILVEKIQLPGGKVINISDWLNSSSSFMHINLCFDT